ncbi:MAG TPA: hypothetical protein DEO84_05510 [candidate division Zixibacteria bacterium]|jgi:hypothetical protein|nr:hypothetical protein [candidate division Zixibacteria bacterium]
MISNLEKYKKDLELLIANGEKLLTALQGHCLPQQFHEALKKQLKDDKKIDKYLKELPSFHDTYQIWYSEALILIRQLLPDRLSDFIKLYERPKTNRKEITHENYVIEDALYGLTITRTLQKEKVVGPDSAIPRFNQQLNIIKSINRRFESSLFDIKQLVQADFFDSELDAAKELNKKGFVRGAGAIAGVVLEGHLRQVCDNHKITVSKKNPTINDFAQLLKDSDVIETPVWRNIQHLADLRNLCDHKTNVEPKREDIGELIDGVLKVTKTLF